MVNIYELIQDHPATKRLQVNDLLFAEYQCPLTETRFDMWSHHNYFVYVLKGKKKWFSGDHEVLAETGDCIFIKKGAHSVYQYFDEDFCSLLMFVPDAFIKDLLLNNQFEPGSTGKKTEQSPILRVNTNKPLEAYFYSFLSYITNPGTADKKLLELKFRELIMIVASDDLNPKTTDYFLSLCKNAPPSIRAIMDSNFTYPMMLEEYARLSGRSLSVFKRDFKATYHTTPGKWLKQKRLNHGKQLLLYTDKSVTEIVLDSGFSNTSHFSRIFKNEFGYSPVQFRKKSQKGS